MKYFRYRIKEMLYPRETSEYYWLYVVILEKKVCSLFLGFHPLSGVSAMLGYKLPNNVIHRFLDD